MTLGCDEIEALIDSEAHGWNDSERLRVEQHLVTCPTCLEQLTLMRVVRDTISAAPPTLSETARHRAIERALSSNAAQPPVPRPSRGPLLGMLAAVSVAAAALLLAWPKPTPHTEYAAPVAQQTPAAAPKPAPAVEGQDWIEASEQRQQQFAHAQVTMAPNTRVRFDSARSTLELQRGGVHVDVDVSQGKPFRVLTSHFRVEVLGTQFTVTPETVRVHEGHVQIFTLEDEVLARDLSKGTTFSYEGVRPKQASDTPDTQVSAHVLLVRARAALLRGNVKGARALIERAEHAEPQRADLAEAITLRAEAALLERKPSAALPLYLRVASQYGDLAAGENAAFAATKLAAKADKPRERALLERYLARYPRGRFADETRARLQKLTP